MRVNPLTEDYDSTSKDRQKDHFEEQLNLVCNPRFPPETNGVAEMVRVSIIRCSLQLFQITRHCTAKL